MFPKSTNLISSNLASHSIPSEVVRENGAPNATIPAYFFCLVHCHQPIIHALRGFLMLFTF